MSHRGRHGPNMEIDSYSSPNLSRYRFQKYSHNNLPSQQHSLHLNPAPLPTNFNHESTFHNASQHHQNRQSPNQYNQQRHVLLQENDSMELCKEESNSISNGTGKMSRSERKRLWRKNLSTEKLAKLRERDALRKRVERMNMSAEKRRDLRTKDTARKAALRKERRVSETMPNSGISTSNDVDCFYESHADKQYHIQRAGGNLPSNDYDEEGFTKIPVRSLLN